MEKYISATPRIEAMARTIEKKGHIRLFGWHKNQMAPLENKGFHLVYFKEDPEYPCLAIKNPLRQDDVGAVIRSLNPYVDSNGNFVWPWRKGV